MKQNINSSTQQNKQLFLDCPQTMPEAPAKSSDFAELEPFAEHKKEAVSNLRFTRFLKSEQTALRVEYCGQYLQFERWQNIQDLQVFKHTLRSAKFCKNRFCVLCSWRKSRRMIAETLSRIEQLGEEQQLSFLMLTLTVPNPPISQLHSTAIRMSKAWHKFSKYKAFTRATLGWVRSLELLGDHTPAGQAHPHFHVLVIVPASYFDGRHYIKQEQWRAMWEQAYGAAGLQVNVSKVRPKKNAAIDGVPVIDSLEAACFEVIKYCVKPAALERLSDDDLKELIKQSEGLRQYAVGGYLAMFEPLIEELDNSIWELVALLSYRWDQALKNYLAAACIEPPSGQ